MFEPQTNRIRKLASHYQKAIDELEEIFNRRTNIYIDWANVLGWQEKLGWHIDLKRLKQLLDSFDTVHKAKFYYGTLEGDKKSEKFISRVENYGYELITKPVKIMKLSIRRVSKELADSRGPIFDIEKIREYICWSKEIPQETKRLLKSQKDS